MYGNLVKFHIRKL